MPACKEVREAALILLYRLLFILYAEDRDLLPVRERRYDDYGLREKRSPFVRLCYNSGPFIEMACGKRKSFRTFANQTYRFTHFVVFSLKNPTEF